MVSPGAGEKRKSSLDGSISPPPLRRKLQSTTTKTAVASFFTPASQKPPEKIIWQERRPNNDSPITLLVGKYQLSNTSNSLCTGGKHDGKRRKIAAFDFDSTLIKTASGKKFASDGNDWKWWHASVPTILRKMYSEEGYTIVVLSNQNSISLKPDTKAPKTGKQSNLITFKSKASAVFDQLDLPVTIYAATEKDIYRKPRIGMWKEVLGDYDISSPEELNLEESIFVGDAAGRLASQGGKVKDFSCSDRNFAENAGIKFYTPEEYFFKEEPKPFRRTFEPSDYLPAGSAAELPEAFVRNNDKDIVLFCGSPGAGKSTFYWRHLEHLGYARVNQDLLKSRDKCIKVAGEYLKEGKSVVVDNTNADSEVRAKWVALAAKHSVPIRCVLFTATPPLCQHNDAVRALNDIMNPEKRPILPGLAFNTFSSRYRKPALSEGFQDITEVEFKFQGNEAERTIWTRHWT